MRRQLTQRKDTLPKVSRISPHATDTPILAITSPVSAAWHVEPIKSLTFLEVSPHVRLPEAARLSLSASAVNLRPSDCTSDEVVWGRI